MKLIEDRAWKLLSVVVTLAGVVVPAAIALHLHNTGGQPEKLVTLDKLGPINPLLDLDPIAEDAELSLKIGDSELDNIEIWRFTLANKSPAAITKSDFSQPLRVETEAPWEIVGIEASRWDSGPIALIWTREDESAFVAEPFLMNPGDRVSQVVYVSATEETDDDSSISIKARIENLKRFYPEDSILGRAVKPTIIDLSLREAILLVVIASAWLLWFLKTARGTRFQGTLSTVFLAALSYSIAEVTVYFIAGESTSYERVFGRDWFSVRAQFQNWLVILVHISVCAYLLWQRRTKNCDPVPPSELPP